MCAAVALLVRFEKLKPAVIEFSVAFAERLPIRCRARVGRRLLRAGELPRISSAGDQDLSPDFTAREVVAHEC